MIRTEAGEPAGTQSVLDGFLTEAELAKELGISTRTLIRWRRLREGPPITRLGRRILYHRQAVAKWLAGRQREAA